jgi:ribonucleoside-diphosphate reductase alpha chain
MGSDHGDIEAGKKKALNDNTNVSTSAGSMTSNLVRQATCHSGLSGIFLFFGPATEEIHIAVTSSVHAVRKVISFVNKLFFSTSDMSAKKIKLTKNAMRVLERRYLAKDSGGRIIETPEQLFRRVARIVAETDARYDSGAGMAGREDVYYDMMASLKFMPNSPTLMNAGTRPGQLSACFVIPVGDSIREIFGAVSTMAVIHQTGGGTGFSFSRLRPKNDVVGSTGGIASGPVSFMKIFDQGTEVIKQGGRRRGANMGILRADHPDIMEFIEAKLTEGAFRNFNLSVAVPDSFMERLEKNEMFPLINPRNGKTTGRLKARAVWHRIAEMAWETGDPGVVFIDRINRMHPVAHVGEIEATNPCGEQPLLPYESCNLGSINLKKVVKNGEIDWAELARLVREGVQFLDGIIDANIYPLREIEEITYANRKIGLGVMGLAEMLIMLDIPYASGRALRIADKVMKTISTEAVMASMSLGERRGSFPNFKGSLWEKKRLKTMRNATVTTIAPTGTISIIAGASSGIEPLFAIAFKRIVMEGTELMEVNELFLDRAKREGFYSKALMEEIARRGSVAKIREVPAEAKKLFMTALDISPAWHVRMQAVFQRHTDNAVSKTINLPNHASVADVEEINSLAYRLGCKGITVFRYGSRREQVLSVEDRPEMSREKGFMTVSNEYIGECKICSV